MKESRLVLILLLITILRSLPASALGGGAYFGTNYTVPFAHAYRALNQLGVDHRQAIDRDVHHMSAMGLNAFRLHLWDVELTDSIGNLIENEHLELLDYLIWRLEQNGISIILTAQTNFGNGYPERNTDPYGAYSYRYEKCRIHDTPAAADAQERYLEALAKHINPNNGLTYSADPAIIAVEINNEPCHSGSEEDIAAYVDRMASALRRAGWNKDILYNVSHNLWRTPAFYRSRINGTTYQWYPTGLVHGSERRGNFLPSLSSYNIPWDTISGYNDKSRVVYEFDPADVLATYLYPACARTFRKAGFEWATQFAYDPLDMARFNTEYQTHFLNLAYTPGKAVGMAIAAEAFRRIPSGSDYGTFPADTIFGPEGEFLVSASRNLAMLNDGTHYYNTASTKEQPRNAGTLRKIKGVGSSPVVTTDGTGAYLLERLPGDIWRLELMPDVYLTADPFGKPSLKRSVADVVCEPVNMTFHLPGLGEDFRYYGTATGRASAYGAVLMPGVYLLCGTEIDPDTVGGARRQDYAMPPLMPVAPKVVASKLVGNTINVTAISSEPLDSVVLYPAAADFWRDDNFLPRLAKVGRNSYAATLPGTPADYRIVLFSNGNATTYPGAVPGTPLNWDFPDGTPVYKADTASPGSPAVLVDASRGLDGAELAMIPETWNGLSLTHRHRSPIAMDALCLQISSEAPALEKVAVTKYTGHIHPGGDTLNLRTAAVAGTDSITVTVRTRGGFSYNATVPAVPNATVRLTAPDFAPAPTMLNPAPYPSFLGRWHTPASWPALSLADTETILWGPARAVPCTVEIEGIWIE